MFQVTAATQPKPKIGTGGIDLNLTAAFSRADEAIS